MSHDFDVFVDPMPVSNSSIRTLNSKEMMDERSGAIIPVVIVTCGGKLGAATVVTVGTAVVVVCE